MSIGKKLLISVIAMVLLSLVVTLFCSNWIFRDNYIKLEKQSLASNVTRAANALSVTINKLTIDTQDWAVWDDTYNFAQSGNPAYGNNDYINNNFTDATFKNKKLNLIVVLDNSNKMVYGKAYDLNSSREMPIPPELSTYFASGTLTDTTGTSGGYSGIILLSDNPLLLSSQPILSSSLPGQSSGTLIFGIIVDSSFINALSQTTQTNITIWQENNTQISNDFRKASDSLSSQGVDFTQPLNRNYAAGYTMKKDLFGKPAIILKTTSSRDIYNQGQTTILFLLLIAAFGSILFSLVFVYIMKKTLLKRLDTLVQNVSVIASTGDVSKPVSLPSPLFKRRDELSDLTENINAMLEKIKETGNNLAYQKYLFERLCLYSPAIILAVDANVKITLVNKAFCTLFNVHEEDAIGKPLSAFFPSEEIAASGKQISDIEGSVTIYEHRPKIGKTERIIDTTIITVRHNEYLLIGRDITQEREEQEKLYLNDRLASIGEMAAGIAHELNNPLTGIVMLSQLLMQTDFPPDVKNDLGDINSEASRATDVVRNLLAFARKQPPMKHLTQLNKTISDVLRLRRYEETVNNIDVITTLDPDLPEIMVDNIQIQQVFLNLVLNAEYSMIHAHKKGQLEVDSSVANGHVIVSFTDDGEGIKEEDMKKMFQPFFTTKEVGIGTGLGLSLCYGIVKRHGGMIHVKSKYGSGATFTVELPIAASNTYGDEIGSK